LDFEEARRGNASHRSNQVVAYRSQEIGSPFSEGTHTLVVNAHGALINLEAKVAVHEKVFLKHALRMRPQ
jgi:hypothetical protein